MSHFYLIVDVDIYWLVQDTKSKGFAEPPATLDHLVVPQVVDVQSSFWLQRKSAAQVRISTIIAESVHFRVDLNERSPHLVGS